VHATPSQRFIMKFSVLASLLFFAPLFAQEEAQQSGGISAFLPFILMFVVMYLFFIMPKQKEMKKMDAMRKALQKGDKVLTAAGIVGVVSNISDTVITVKTGDSTKIDFEKSAILRILEDKPEAK